MLFKLWKFGVPTAVSKNLNSITTIRGTGSQQQSEILDHDDVSTLPTDCTNVLKLESQLSTLLERLRTSLKQYPECKRHDDEFLSKFLRVKNYSVERALANIRAFYCLIERNHHLIDGIRPSDFQPIYDAQIMNLLRFPNAQGAKVGIVRPQAWDTSKYNFQHLFQAALLLHQHGIQDLRAQLNGLTIIYDLGGLSFSHVRQITPNALQLVAASVQGGLPLKLIGIHFVNYPSFFCGLFSIAQGFMNPKLRERVHFHKTLDSLHSHFRMNILPQELGGEVSMEKVVDKEFMKTFLRDNYEYMYYC